MSGAVGSGGGRAASLRQAMAAASVASVASGAMARESAPPAPGDRFVIERTADWPVEWVLLEAQGNGAFLAVPADVHPLAGGSDVAPPPGAGALRLRCGFPVRLEAGWLVPERRTGTIDRFTLENARRAVREEGSRPRSEVDDLSEYQDWIQGTIAPAVAGIGGIARTQIEAVQATGWPRGAVLALAASLTLVVAGALAGWTLWNQGQAALERERIAYKQEGSAAQAKAELQIAGLKAELERQARSQDQTNRRFESALAAVRAPEATREPMINLPAVQLYAQGDDVFRSVSKPFRFSEGDQELSVTLSLPEEPRHTTWRVILRRQGETEPVWQQDGALRIANGEVNFLVQRKLLPAGSYRFELLGLSGKKTEPLGEFPLEVVP